MKKKSADLVPEVERKDGLRVEMQKAKRGTSIPLEELDGRLIPKFWEE